MSANTWFIIAIVGFSLAALLLIIAVFMFIKMNIPAIIGDLTGKTAARQIEEIREMNRATGDKRHKPDAFNLERGALTEEAFEVSFDSNYTLEESTSKLSEETTPLRENGSSQNRKVKTEILSDVIEAGSKTTDVLAETAATTDVLNSSDGETDILAQSGMVTDILVEENNNGTQVLSDEISVSQGTVYQPGTTMEVNSSDKFIVIKDVVVIHTEEMIG